MTFGDDLQTLGSRLRPRVLVPPTGVRGLPQDAVVSGESLQALAACARTGVAADLVVADPPFSAPDFRYDGAWERDPEVWSPGSPIVDPGERDERWERFMLPRLQGMRDVLAATGVLALVSDQRNLFRVGMLVDRVFGVENRLTVVGFARLYVMDGFDGCDYLYVIVAGRDLAAWARGPGAGFGPNPPQWWSPTDLGDAPPPRVGRYNTVGMEELRGLIGPHRFWAAKPLAIYRKLIDTFAPAGGLVLDPFAGSGVAGHAAALSSPRRHFLLIDDPSVIETVAAPRLRAAEVAFRAWQVAEEVAFGPTG